MALFSEVLPVVRGSFGSQASISNLKSYQSHRPLKELMIY